jgi:hypothetical protein
MSPTVAQLAAGDANCPAGGASITDAASHVGYVCNGTNGTNGSDGEAFAGTFTSPNGQYKLEVADTGITLQGPVGRIRLTPSGTEVRADTDLTLRAGAIAKLQGDAQVQLNGCGATVARVGDTVFGLVTVGPDGGTFPLLSGAILTGAPTVCAGS